MKYSGNSSKDQQQQEDMSDRKRTYSSKYRPLDESETLLGEEGEVAPEDERTIQCPRLMEQRKGYVERVVIVSEPETNGDADSGIAELAGEENGHIEGGDGLEHVVKKKRESLLVMMVQIVIPFFFAGFGMMAAGLLLDAVQVRSHTIF